MKTKRYIIWVGVATAAGAAMGLLADRRQPAKGLLLGAAAGMTAGSVAAGVYHGIAAGGIPYYSEDSALYDDLEAV